MSPAASRATAAAAAPFLPPPEFAKSLATEMETDAQALARRLGPLAIRNVPDLEQAALDRQSIGEALKKIDDFFAPLCDLAYKLHRAITSRRAEVKAPLETIDAKLRNAISAYKAEADRRRREEEQRIAEDRRREEERRLSAEAAAIEQTGDHVLAAAVFDTALEMPMPVVVLPDSTKVAGLSFRRVWKWRYLNDDKDRALQLIPREYLCVDESKLTKYAGAMRESAKVPGIQFYSEDVPVRGR